jgi:hypothetical protein
LSWLSHLQQQQTNRSKRLSRIVGVLL